MDLLLEVLHRFLSGSETQFQDSPEFPQNTRDFCVLVTRFLDLESDFLLDTFPPSDDIIEGPSLLLRTKWFGSFSEEIILGETPSPFL